MSDGPNAVPLNRMRELLASLQQIDLVVKAHGLSGSRFRLTPLRNAMAFSFFAQMAFALRAPRFRGQSTKS